MQDSMFINELSGIHKRNTFWNSIDASFISISFACYVPSVIIVALLRNYTSNQILLNMPVFIDHFTLAVFPFLMSVFSAKTKKKKPVLLFLAGMQRFSWILLIATVYFFSENSRLILPLFFMAFFIFSALNGSALIFWQEFIGRSLHPDRRGSAMGLREAVGNIVGFLASFPVIIILKNFSFPGNYTLLFIIGLFAGFGSFISLFMMKEAEYREVSKKKGFMSHWKDILLLPKKDKTFKWFSIYTLFIYGILFVVGQYTSECINRFGEVMDKNLLTGLMSAVSLLSAAGIAFIIGRIFEKKGKLTAFTIVSILTIIHPILAMLSKNVYAYLATFLFSGSIIAIFILEFTILLQFAPPEKVNKYIAFLSVFKILPIIIYTNLGGYLTNRISPEFTFILAALFGIAALIVLYHKLAPIWKEEI